MWGTVLKRDLLGEFREEDKFRSKEQLQEYLESEIEKQGKNVVIRNLDVSLIEDLRELFCRYHNKLESLDLSGWKTSGVKNMSYMFYEFTMLESIDLSGWNTSNIKYMTGMFSDCTNLKSLNLSGWNISNVGYMYGIFNGCDALELLDLSGWDTYTDMHPGWTFVDHKVRRGVVDGNILKK